MGPVYTKQETDRWVYSLVLVKHGEVLYERKVRGDGVKFFSADCATVVCIICSKYSLGKNHKNYLVSLLKQE